GVEVLGLGRDPGAVGRGVEVRDRPDARRALDQVRPDRFAVVADGRDKTQAGDGHAAAVACNHCSQQYGPNVQYSSAGRLKKSRWFWTRCLKKAAEVERQLQAVAGGGRVEVTAQQLLDLAQAVEHRVPVQVQIGGGLLHRCTCQIGLQGLEQDVVPPLVGQQGTQNVVHVALDGERVLGQDQVGR